MRFENYRDLKVWQLGMVVTKRVYELTVGFPKHEVYGLTSQLRRAAASIPANLAEGHARDSTKEFLRFVSMSQGSRAELETHLLIAAELGMGVSEDRDDILRLSEELGRLLRGLQKSRKNRLKNDEQRP